MSLVADTSLDLMPPDFAEGLDDWSCGDGTPACPTYEAAANARIARGDADFGTCMELRTVEAVQRLRYMGEMPVRAGGYLEISATVKAMRGPLPWVRIAAWPGGLGGVGVIGLRSSARTEPLVAHQQVLTLRAVIGPRAATGVDLVWDHRALYAHVGIDLIGAEGAVVRVGCIAVRDVTVAFSPQGRIPPGFEARR